MLVVFSPSILKNSDQRHMMKIVAVFNDPSCVNVRQPYALAFFIITQRRAIFIFEPCRTLVDICMELLLNKLLSVQFDLLTSCIVFFFLLKEYVLSNFNSQTQQPDTCNCRKKPDCLIEGKCLQSNVIYQATATTATTTETYVGLATNFKERYRNHQSSFRRSNRRNETELSKYIWTLQDSKKPFQIKWKVLKKCKPYSNISKKCNLCLYEKFIIICKKELCSLNRRNELASSCPHRNRYVLQNSRVT